MKRLVLYGTGYLDIRKHINAVNRRKKTFQIMGFINDLPEFQGKKIIGLPVLGGREVIPGLHSEGDICFFNNINSTRANARKIASILEKNGCEIASIIHPSVELEFVRIGRGVLLPNGCIVGSGVKIGNYLSCRLGVVISHDVTIGDFVYLSPGVTCCGKSVVESDCFIGAGTTIMPGVRVGRGSVVGAGSLVNKDIPENVLAFGSPAKPVREIDENFDMSG